MPAAPPLRRTQHFVYRAITKPGSDEAALRGADRLIIPSRTLTAQERLGIYRDMYLGRMHDALASDYPFVQSFLGERRFFQLIAAYVERFPSRSYTLNRLGDHFPRFVGETTGVPRQAFLVDLARLELQMTIAFDEEQAAPLTQKAIRKVRPEQWETAILRTVPALRLVECDYPSNDYIQSVRDEKTAPPLRKKKNWVVVYRRNYQLHRMEVSRAAFKLLSFLKAGRPLGEAIETVCLDPSEKVGDVQLSTWFREWMEEGLFCAVDTPSS